MIILRLTEDEAKTCAQACEFFARIRMGQFQEIIWLCGENHCAENYEKAQQAWLALRKQVYPFLDGPGHSYGVGHFPEADTAYDISQVINAAMGGKEPWSLNPLPECSNTSLIRTFALLESMGREAERDAARYEREGHGSAAKLHRERDEALLVAADAIREKLDREKPKPLTYEELILMVGEPVYVTVPGKPHRSKWCIVHSTMDGPYLARPDYGLSLDAVELGAVVVYRTKPEEGSA